MLNTSNTKYWAQFKIYSKVHHPFSPSHPQVVKMESQFW